MVKCGELSTMWDYRKKQKQKIELLKSTRAGTDACMLQDKESSAGRAGRLESTIAHGREPGVHACACLCVSVPVCCATMNCAMHPCIQALCTHSTCAA